MSFTAAGGARSGDGVVVGRGVMSCVVVVVVAPSNRDIYFLAVNSNYGQYTSLTETGLLGENNVLVSFIFGTRIFSRDDSMAALQYDPSKDGRSVEDTRAKSIRDPLQSSAPKTLHVVVYMPPEFGETSLTPSQTNTIRTQLNMRCSTETAELYQTHYQDPSGRIGLKLTAVVDVVCYSALETPTEMTSRIDAQINACLKGLRRVKLQRYTVKITNVTTNESKYDSFIVDRDTVGKFNWKIYYLHLAQCVHGGPVPGFVATELVSVEDLPEGLETAPITV